MYKIYADDTLIYDSTFEDYKIGKGNVSLEINKSGSFTFSLYPDHFFYDSFVKLKTVITVYKAGRIVFRGRVLNDVCDYWNQKTLTCEGELGFLQDSVIRPYSFKGTPAAFLKQIVDAHNSQVDDFKKFKIGRVTVTNDGSNIDRSDTEYGSSLDTLNGQLVDTALGGYLFITHGDDGTDPIPTINYLSAFERVASQAIEFGENLKNYTKTAKADDLATAIIPLGSASNDSKLTIKSVNGGVDYIYSAEGVALFGWIFKTVEWNDITSASKLLSAAEAYLDGVTKQNITIELTAIDLHLLDRSIESFRLGDYIRGHSSPHNFDAVMLCSKQTLDLLKPENDTLTLGYTYSSFTDITRRTTAAVSYIAGMKGTLQGVTEKLGEITVIEEKVTTLTAKTPQWCKTSEALSLYLTYGESYEVDISFPLPFAAVPAVVLAAAHCANSYGRAHVTVNSITATGFHATITNTGDSDATFTVVYIAYPEETTTDTGTEVITE